MIAALLAGLALGLGSAAHCAGMCGPLSVMACSKRSARTGWGPYLAGRVASYGLLGAALGGLSAQASMVLRGPWAGALASWALALALGTAALRLWHRPITGAPPLVRLRPSRKPRAAGAFVSLWRRLAQWPPAAVGAGQVLLPCGALAAAALAAASRGAVVEGALVMAGFALSSSAGLLAAGLSGRWLGRVRHPVASRGLAAVLAVGAVFMVVRPVPALRAAAESTEAAPTEKESTGAPCPLHAAP